MRLHHLCRCAIFAVSDLNELVSHNYVTTFMKIKGFPPSDVTSQGGNFVCGASPPAPLQKRGRRRGNGDLGLMNN